MQQAQDNAQAEVIRFLLSPDTYPGHAPITHIETHGAHVFLCGDLALKIKRAVRYDYMDLSTLQLRHALLDRELQLNRVTAPMIYRDVVPITRDSTGLALDGKGPPVEWVLRMHRFAAECEMTAVAASGRLTDPCADALGRAIHAFHAGCPQRSETGDALIRDILDELDRVLAPFDAPLGHGTVRTFLDCARRALAKHAPALRDRSASGHVRRVHGDLHLRNLLLIDGEPVLFDALEFDERLATCDVLYDLAFLLMDLCHQGFASQSSAALAAYLLAAGGAEDAGLAALPLFMSVRAAIRAMVLLQTDEASGHAGTSAAEARQYLDQAITFLQPRRPVLIAVGGISGTGKSVLSRDLATRIGTCPGAVHLRTDTERKAQTPAASYDPAARSAVYARMFARAATLIAAGGSVILDGTFLDPAQRITASALASRLGVAFHGLWLTAPRSVLIDRVESRRGDASDADAAVVQAQMAAPAPDAAQPEPGWLHVDASGTIPETSAAARVVLADMLELTGGEPAQP